MRNRARGLAAMAVLAIAPGAALACGACVEDKVAAVYDHGVAESAAKQGHRIAFLALDGPLAAGERSRRAVAEALARSRGVDRATVRVSIENAACAAAFDPARTSAAAIAAELGRRLASSGITATPLDFRAN